MFSKPRIVQMLSFWGFLGGLPYVCKNVVCKNQLPKVEGVGNRERSKSVIMQNIICEGQWTDPFLGRPEMRESLDQEAVEKDFFPNMLN